MRIEDQEMQVVNSSFTNLTSHGNAVLQFVRSTALIQSSIFVNNIQAQSGKIHVLPSPHRPPITMSWNRCTAHQSFQARSEMD